MRKNFIFTAACLVPVLVLAGCSVLGENASSGVVHNAVSISAGDIAQSPAPQEIFGEDIGLIQGAGTKNNNTTDRLSEAFGATFDDVGVVNGDETAITVSFPFKENMKGYSLMYIKTDEKCFMRLFDAKGNMIQEFGDMDIKGVPYFKYDNLISGGDYQGFSVFDPEKTDAEFSGYYYSLDENGKKFNFDAVDIPAYDGLLEGTYNILMYNEDRQDFSGSRDFYEICWEINKCVKCKRWEYEVAEENYEKTTMKIFDTIEDKLIYEGPVELDNDLEPINQDFYKSMIINNLQVYSEELKDQVIYYADSQENLKTAEKNVSKKAEADQQAEEAGNAPNAVEYKDLKECLKAAGLKESDSIGEYIDEFGNKEFEVFYDKASGKGIAVMYRWYYSPSMQKKSSIEAFPVTGYIRSKKSRSFQPMSVSVEEGMSGYYKTSEYISGRLRNLEIMDFDRTLEGPGYETLIRENFVYRDDGTLYYHGRSHNAYYYGIDYMAMNEKYDLKSRLCYSSALVMTGSNELYNFYEGDSSKPKYQIFLDKMEEDNTVEIEINELK